MTLLDRKLLRDILAMRGQVMTIALVVAAGMAVFIASISTYNSLRAGRDRFYASARFPQVFVTLKRAPLSVVAQLSEIPGVAAVEPRIVRDVILDWPSALLPVSARMVSLTHAGDEPLARLHIRRGTAPERRPRPEPGDTRTAAINEAFAEANPVQLGTDVPVVLNGRIQNFRVAAVALSPEYVYAVKPGVPIPDDRFYAVLWVDRSAAEAAFDMKGAFNDAIVSLTPGTDPRQVIDELDRLLEPYGSVGAIGRRDQPSNRFLEDELNQQKVMSITIPFIFFGVAAFLLNVVLGRLVTAQREQIAALKALGFPTTPLVLHYLKLVAVVVLFGSALGLAGGFAVRRGDGGKLSRLLSPAGAGVRADAMVRARRLPDQLCGGIARRGDGAAKRRRAGSGGSDAAGRAAAFSPLVDRGTAVGEDADAAARAGDPQFCRPSAAQRIHHRRHRAGGADGRARAVLAGRDRPDDRGPVQPGRTRQRHGHLPPSAQPHHHRRSRARARRARRRRPSRFVPVRLRAGHRSYLTSVIGLPFNAGLRRPHDAALRPIDVPPDGITLTRRLAERIQVASGEIVTIEVMEGRRRKIDLPVSAIVDETIGMSSYMEIDTLNRLTGEGAVVSAASLFVEPSALPALSRRFKELPVIESVAVKTYTLSSFLDKIAGIVLVSAGILTAFAVIVAVGVVYNSARIALQERAWELASLRVLGFTRAEVARILFSQFAAEIALAIPIGLMLSQGVVTLIARFHSNESFQIPGVVGPRTYVVAVAIVVATAAASAYIVRRRVDRLDLVAVLKTRD